MSDLEIQKIKDYVVNYLLESGFVNALVKKSIFSSDINDLYEDYVNEVWLAILEQKPSIWVKLYNTAKEKGTDLEYQARNYFSRVILNTCRSTSSNAYKKLKKHSTTELYRNNVQWEVMENTIPDPQTITELIRNNLD